MYKNKVNRNFDGRKILEENECFSVLLLNSVGKIKKYPQISLEECKYRVKKKNIIDAINEELNLDESDNDESD